LSKLTEAGRNLGSARGATAAEGGGAMSTGNSLEELERRLEIELDLSSSSGFFGNWEKIVK